jgi:hypothetical protein
MKREVVLIALVACVGVTTWNAAGEPPSVTRDAGWVSQRVAAWQPTRAERAFDEIGWAADLREAQRLARQHGRPVFLFTYDGASLSGYRC